VRDEDRCWWWRACDALTFILGCGARNRRHGAPHRRREQHHLALVERNSPAAFPAEEECVVTHLSRTAVSPMLELTPMMRLAQAPRARFSTNYLSASTDATSTFFRGKAAMWCGCNERRDGAHPPCVCVLDSMEGRWNGECVAVPLQEEGSQVCSNDLIYRDGEGAKCIVVV